MTYASRSQHLKLARQISELSQRKFLDGLGSDLSEEEGDGEWANQDAAEDQRAELSYAKARMSSLKRGPSTLLPSGPDKTFGKGGSGSGRSLVGASAKFSQYAERGNIGHRNSSKSERE